MTAAGQVVDASTPPDPGAARTLLLLRHGQTSWNAAGRAQGHLEVGLDELGLAQAGAMAGYLAGQGPAALWSSDLVRARQTCGYLEATTGLVATYDHRLREYDVGLRQGLTSEELAERHPDVYRAWVAEPGRPVPGAESAADVAKRLVPALRECLDALAPGQVGIVVSHGACLKVGIAGLLDWPPDLERTLQGLGNCAWAEVAEHAATGSVRLLGYNLTAPVPG